MSKTIKFMLCGGLISAILTPSMPAFAQDYVPTPEEVTARAAHKPIAAQKIILVGDSTTQVFSGWGGEFCAQHLTSFISCINLARGGRSSYSYRAEKSWDIALSEMQVKGYQKIYVLIQLGHNDMPGKPGRSTDLKTEFPKFMTEYVREVKANGAIPILITPLTRRTFKNGILDNDLMPWADAIRKIASTENVALLDLNKLSAEYVQQLGPVESLKLAQLPPPNNIYAEAVKSGTSLSAPKITPSADAPKPKINLSFDYTHIGDAGAKAFAKIVAAELAKLEPDLANQIIP